MADLIGQTLGQYKLTERLGRGGMADVYKAFHTGLSVYRAIKVIRPEFVSSEDFRARFQKEAQAVASLRHPNIVQIHDFGIEGDTFYMVMEFVEGTDLKELLKQEGRIRPISKVVDIVRQIASALDYAHKRDLIHRDIKPDNIMLNKEGLPILMDFGIAKLVTESTQLTQTGTGIGTPAYMAPEQAKAIGDLGPTADIYSLSIVLFEILTGTQPFSADTPMAVMLKAISDPLPLPRSFANDISEALEGIILKGTAKDPKDRYPSASLLYEALEGYVNVDSEQATMIRTVPDPAHQPTDSPESASKSDKSKYVALTVVLLLAAITTGYFYLTLDSAETSTRLATNLPQGTDVDNAPALSPALPEARDQTAAAKPTERANSADNQQSSVLLSEYRGTTEAEVALARTIDVSQGDVLYLDVIAAKPTTDFSLTSADGRTQLFKGYGDVGPVTVKENAAMQLSILTRGKKSGTIDYQLWKLEPAVIKGEPIQPGAYSSGEIATPGQVINYTVELNQGDSVFFDLEKSSSTTDFTLTTPDGRTQIFTGYSDNGPKTVPVTGTYSLQADPRSEKLATFEFTLYKIEIPQKQGGIIEAGKYVAGSTETPGQTVVYNMELSEGDTIYFDLEKSSTTTDFSLMAPGARKPVFKSYGDHGPVQVTATGSFSLLADPRADKLSAYEFTLYKLSDPQKQGGSIELGKYVSGATEIPGQTVSYNVELFAGDAIFFDVEKSSTTTDFSLWAPGARKPTFTSYSDKGPFTVENSARYSLVADPRADKVSVFEFVFRKAEASELE